MVTPGELHFVPQDTACMFSRLSDLEQQNCEPKQKQPNHQQSMEKLAKQEKN